VGSTLVTSRQPSNPACHGTTIKILILCVPLMKKFAIINANFERLKIRKPTLSKFDNVSITSK